jgi:hypothetical protein
MLNNMPTIDTNRRKRKRLPTVNARDVGEVRIAHSLKRKYRRRADRIATQKYDPQIQALRAQKRGIARAQDKALASNAGYVDQSQAALQSAIEGLKSSGLKGHFLADAVNELTARSADTAQSLPFLNSDTRQEFTSQKADAKSAIVDAKITEQQAAADKFQSLMAAARETGQQQLAREDTAQGDAAQAKKDRETALRNALHEGHRLINLLPPEIKNADGTTIATSDWLQQPESWDKLEAEIRKAEGVDYEAARRAASVLWHKIHPPGLGEAAAMLGARTAGG